MRSLLLVVVLTMIASCAERRAELAAHRAQCAGSAQYADCMFAADLARYQPSVRTHVHLIR